MTHGPFTARLAAPLAALALAALVACSQLAQAADTGCNPVRADGEFTTIAKPDALGQLTTIAAGGAAGRAIFASDGRLVMRSLDGGCSWKESYAVDGNGAEGLPRVSQIAISGLAGMDGQQAVLMVLDGVGRSAASRLMVSIDSGQSWEQIGNGLPPAGRYRQLAISRSDPSVAYLSVTTLESAAGSDPIGLTGSLYRSEDGGQSWQQRASGPAFVDLEIDPFNANVIFAVRGDRQVVRSTDGGAEFGELPMPKGSDQQTSTTVDEPWRDIAVTRRRDDGATIVVTAAPSETARVFRAVASVDNGGSFRDISHDSLGAPGGLVFGSAPSQLFSTSYTGTQTVAGPGLLRYEGETDTWRDADPMELLSLREPSSVDTGGSTRGGARHRSVFTIRDAPGADPAVADSIVKFDPPDPPSERQQLIVPSKEIDCTDRPPLTRREAPKAVGKFTQGNADLALEPNVPNTQQLRVELPKAPSPLDLAFVLDASDSMEPAIDGVLCSVDRLVREFVDRGVDLNVAVVTFRSHEDRYERVLNMTPPGPDVTAALRSIFTLQGDREPLRSALFQMVTGSGVYSRNATEDSPEVEPTVIEPPGRAVTFREDSIRFAFAVTDEPYDETLEDEPLKEVVAGALREAEVRTVGLQVLDGAAQVAQPQRPALEAQLRTQLEYFARESGALAPRGGLDCDGDGNADVAEDGPMVCGLGRRGIKANLGDTLVTILRGLRDVRKARIVPSTTSGLIVEMAGGEAEINLKQPNALEGAATVTCTAVQAGRRYPLVFDAVIGRRVVAQLKGTATCGNVAAVPPPRLRKPVSTPPVETQPQPPVKPAAVTSPAPPNPNPAIAVAPPPPPPSPVPVASGAPASASATSSAAASASSPAPAAGVAAAPQSRTAPRLAQVRSDGPNDRQMVASQPRTAFGRAHRKVTEHQMVAARPRAFAHARHHAARPGQANSHPLLITLGLGACSALGYVAVASHRTRRRIRAVEARWNR